MNFEFELSQEDVERFKTEFEAVANESSADALKRMGDVAVEHLRSLDEDLGHHYLASLWEATDPVDDGDSISVEVHSRAETETFFDSGWGPNGERIHRDPRFPVPGRMLLAVLEGGAKPHLIFPRNVEKLVIPVPGIAERTEAFHKAYGFSYEYNPGTSEDTWFVEDVVHPGVLANHNVESTAELLEIGLNTYADGIADEISVRLR